MLTTREKRFFRYTTVGVSTFLLDLVLLFLLIEWVGMHYALATALAFLAAVSLNYFLSRRWAFHGSHRTMGRGYLYFLQFALLGAGATTFLMWFLTTQTPLHFVLVRVLIAGVVGMSNYLLNLYLNFKVAGKELEW